MLDRVVGPSTPAGRPGIGAAGRWSLVGTGALFPGVGYLGLRLKVGYKPVGGNLCAN